MWEGPETAVRQKQDEHCSGLQRWNPKSLPTHSSKCGVYQAEGLQESAKGRALPAEKVLHMGQTAQGPWPVKLQSGTSGGPRMSSEAGGYYHGSSEGFPNFRPGSQFPNSAHKHSLISQTECYSFSEPAVCELRRERAPRGDRDCQKKTGV